MKTTTGKMKPFAKLVIALAIIGLGWFGITQAKKHGFLMGGSTVSTTVEPIDLPTAPKNAASTVTFNSLPTTDGTDVSGDYMHFQIWEWNSQMGLILSNGGSKTTKGSIMESNGTKVWLERQDETSEMQKNLIKFATGYAKNGSTTDGTQFVAIMGDASWQFLDAINKELIKIGPDYIAQVIGSCGKSYGEDKFMGLKEWKQNPQNAKGAVVCGVVRDGDWNIVIKWASDNNIKVNTNDKIYDPEAINFINASNYNEAANMYIANYTEERPVYKNGKATGEVKKLSINGVTTWTPGDVNVAEKKGGLVSIVSTKEYDSQMPNVIIGIKKYMQDNRTKVVAMLKSIGEGGDQVKSYSKALDYAGSLSAQIYNDQDGAYWVKYYKGVTESDAQGFMIPLGGSAVYNLADNQAQYGLLPGSSNSFKIIYEVFGKAVAKMYPDLYPDGFPASSPIETILDLSYLQAAVSSSSNLASADLKSFDNSDMVSVVSKKSYAIEFQTGKATFTPEALATLEDLYNQLVIASNLKVAVHGYTDNVGNSASNLDLSDRRAKAIKDYLESKSPLDFPSTRTKTYAHGDENPIASNTTEEGRSKNRRVEIILGE